jgi:hypothetical protein
VPLSLDLDRQTNTAEDRGNVRALLLRHVHFRREADHFGQLAGDMLDQAVAAEIFAAGLGAVPIGFPHIGCCRMHPVVECFNAVAKKRPHIVDGRWQSSADDSGETRNRHWCELRIAPSTQLERQGIRSGST